MSPGQDLNLRPAVYKTAALPSELPGHKHTQHPTRDITHKDILADNMLVETK